MKWLVLQLLTLYCLMIMPVTGKMKERVEVETQRPVYIVPKPELLHCANMPNYHDCQRKCEFYSDCIIGYECCLSICGKICMKIPEPETSTNNNNPSSTVVSTVVPLNTSEMSSIPKGRPTNST
uniref:WAP four-disulfide core domain protein 10A-like n=1 Tax=Halichoerus grypus TaxID=9711 RepID=UPI001659B4E7|nr:WAP four-disulfide core domain protein 10A-like [Halichoerus grypus]